MISNIRTGSDVKIDIVMVVTLSICISLLSISTLLSLSIDDVGTLVHDDPYKKFQNTFGQWNRYITLVSTNIFGGLNIPVSYYLNLGWIFCVISLSFFLVKFIKLLAPKQSLFVRFQLCALAAVFPYMFNVLHFKLIGFSVGFVYLALLGLVLSWKKPLWVQCLWAAISVTVIAGSYQSGLYWLIITLVGLGVKKSIDGDSVRDLVVWGVVVSVGLAFGLCIYSGMGALIESTGIVRKHSFATLPEMQALLKQRVSPKILRFHVRDMSIFPKWLKLFTILHISIFVALTLVMLRRRLATWLAIGLFIFALFLGAIQFLMIPYNYKHVPVRSFWFFGYSYAVIAALYFTACKADLRGVVSKWVERVNKAVVTFVVILFAFYTGTFSSGLYQLRNVDKMQAELLGQELRSVQFRNGEKVAIYVGSKAKDKIRHQGVTGAVRSLFWVPWSRTQYLETVTGLKVKDAPREAFKEASEVCPALNPERFDKVVVQRAQGYILACL